MIRDTSDAGRQYVGAGIILMRRTSEDMEYLLLQGRAGGVWSFPKGHPEETDRGSPLRTAVRETQEETGFVGGRDYCILGNPMRFGKRPYWLGLMTTDAAPHLAVAEHSGYAWMTAGAIRGLTNTNGDVRAWTKKAESNISTFNRTLTTVSRLFSATSSTLPTHLNVEGCSESSAS